VTVRLRSAPHALVTLPGMLRRSGAHVVESRRERNFYSTFLHPGDLVFDIGANVGDRVDVFLRLGARVVAVEPQAHCVETLRARGRDEPSLAVVAKAVGAEEGHASMYVGEVDTLTTLSPRWIETTQASGRFSAYRWDEPRDVEVTTLDRLIDEFGVPAFCKIDVEGFESQVLAGLTQPMPALSFEFVREALENARACVETLDGLGDARFNYSLGAKMELVLTQAVSGHELLSMLESLPDRLAMGDVYASFPTAAASVSSS
jgi:FkbM family methyltransferase